MKRKEKENSRREKLRKPKMRNQKAMLYNVLPYMKGASEKLKRIFKKRNIALHHKAGPTLRTILIYVQMTN